MHSQLYNIYLVAIIILTELNANLISQVLVVILDAVGNILVVRIK